MPLLCVRVEEKRDDAVNEDAVSSYRQSACQDPEASGYKARLADIVERSADPAVDADGAVGGERSRPPGSLVNR